MGQGYIVRTCPLRDLHTRAKGDMTLLQILTLLGFCECAAGSRSRLPASGTKGFVLSRSRKKRERADLQFAKEWLNLHKMLRAEVDPLSP
jgi:hypothetical protein